MRSTQADDSGRVMLAAHACFQRGCRGRSEDVLKRNRLNQRVCLSLRLRITPESFPALKAIALHIGAWLANADRPEKGGYFQNDYQRSQVNHLFVTQSKTGHILALPLLLPPEAASVSLADITEKDRE
ncbi:MAG: hypothetical protein K0S95_867 [Pantoea eucrina]|jgi:hypothetical protein|uniref:hypothetical protein n=1 Tax=Pantoea sp. SIMBA_079 TaxID=3085817 RepID=UPI0026F2BBD0|nr:hypothetical protein [uncultured Pantoea sp.]MDF2784332.1 hypothetical protein [Pantoea eucrina]